MTREPGGPARFPAAALLVALLLGLLGGWALGRLLPGSVAAPPGEARRQSGTSPVLASVDGETITLEEFRERWRQLDAAEQSFHGARAREAGVASGQAHFLEQLVEEMLLAREARRRGMDTRLDVREATRACANRIVSRPLLAREVREAAIPRSEIEGWYARNSGSLGSPPRVQVREIVVTRTISGPSDDTPDELSARAKAEDLLQRARAGESFATLAETSSESPSSRYGGLVGWVVAGRYARAWEEAALALQPGEISELLEIPEGFAILHADAREDSTIPPLEEVKDRVVEILLADDVGALQRRYNIFVRGLREAARVEIHADLLGRDDTGAGDNVPAASEGTGPGEAGR